MIQKWNEFNEKHEKNNFFYFIKEGKYLICDLENCEKSKRTFDISIFDLANNEKLLNMLQLYYLEGNYETTYESRAKWFCGYLSSFNTREKSKQYQKLITNPTVRILISDDSMLATIELLIKLNLV